MIYSDCIIPIPDSLLEEEIAMGVKKGRQTVKVRLVQDHHGTKKVHGFNAKLHFGDTNHSVQVAFNRNDFTFNSKKQADLDKDNKKADDVYKFYKKNEDYLKGAIYYARDLIADKYLNYDNSITEKDIEAEFKKYSQLPKEEQERYQEECNGN